ncbi:PRSS12 [Branchiostoma lanceolatum]|uniref:PRSS12 protein n=1 Tax=Branchiostoma lanceolatum TaxID=7740 RepID=A0A8K0EDN0_BRALA|nr:PRSS12 [Branchiostoma lanceolatum]
MLAVAIAVSATLFAAQSAAVREDQDVNQLERDIPAHLAGRTVRLVGGNGTYGRVEVLHEGVWGSVCDDQFDMEDGRVVCRQLGLPGVVDVYHQAAFGSGSGPIWLDNVDCKGDELRIESCSHNGWNVTDCKHEEDAGVACLHSPTELQLMEILNEQAFHIIQQSKLIKQRQQTIDQLQQTLESLKNTVESVQLYDGIQQTEIGQLSQEFDGNMKQLEDLREVSIVPVRLAGANATSFQGRVEVFYDGEWGSICDDNWGIEEANAVCRELGFPQATQAIQSAAATFGEGTGIIWLDDVSCQGNETSLSQCTHKDWGDHNCKHEEDAGVVCYEWKAGFSASPSSTFGATQADVIFNVIDTNVGGHYDETSGKFRAPVDGHYMFFFNGYQHGANSMYIDLIVNDVLFKGQWVYGSDSHDSYDTASNSIILHLNMGEEVNLRVRNGYYLGGGVRTSFSGFLLSADSFLHV